MASKAILTPETEKRSWFTAAELAELALPSLPADKRSINRRAQEERWSVRTDANDALLVRPRASRGGGIEYHISLLPGEARIELARRGISEASEEPSEIDENASGWRWFESQTEKTKAEAQRRLEAVRDIELLEGSALTRTAAVAAVSADISVGKSTLWNWLKMVEGIAPADRLPALAPQRKGGGAKVDIAPLLWSAFKSDYLRASAPTMTSCYARVAAIAEERGMDLPSDRTFRRKLEAEIDPRIITLKREGEEALRRSIPAQRRTVSHYHALEHVNIDGHKFDVFAKDDDGTVFRPLMVAIQDLYSRKIVAWRVGKTETSLQTRLVFADLFQNFGIPKACTLDNGRAFASKLITGGAKTRFRYKIRDEDPTGLLVSLGIEVKWAKPHRGQSKPIERAFRDLCDTIAKHPAMEGAYTGNTPLAKPENYGSKAVPMETFCQLVDQGIANHNAKLGRRTENARGRSFDAVFAESYATAPIGKATPEQMRLALLAAEQILVNKQTGEVKLYGNRYWSPECGTLHGQRVTVRFDPDNLHQSVFLYASDGRFLTEAILIADTGFDDVAGAKATQKRHADYRKLIRNAADAEQLIAAEELAAMQADAVVTEVPKSNVIRPVQPAGRRGGNAAAAALKLQPQIEAHRRQETRVFEALRLVEDDE